MCTHDRMGRLSFLYLYVDEDTLNVLRLEKPFKRFHKVLHKIKHMAVILSLKVSTNVCLLG